MIIIVSTPLRIVASYALTFAAGALLVSGARSVHDLMRSNR